MNQVKGKTFSFERAQLVDASISLLYQFNNIERTDNSEQVILEALSDSHPHQVTYSEFVFSLFEHLSASAFHPNEFEMQCLYSLVLSNHSANGNTQLLIDDIIFHMIQNGCFEQSWRLLKSASVNYQIEDLYSSTITALFQNIKYFLPYIYTDIEGSTSLNTIGLSLISKYSFSHENQFHLDFWADNLFTHNVTRIAQKIFVCNASAEFVCSWGVTVLMHESQCNQKSIVDLFRDQVCDNYPHIARTIIGRAISAASESFPTLNELQNHCNTVIDAIETISKTKDFIPPLDQLQAYRSAHHKFEQKIMQDSHKKSIFYNPISNRLLICDILSRLGEYGYYLMYFRQTEKAKIIVNVKYFAFPAGRMG